MARIALAKIPLCEVCEEHEAVYDAAVSFNGEPVGWTYCCEDCWEKYGIDRVCGRTYLVLRAPDWVPGDKMVYVCPKCGEHKSESKRSVVAHRRRHRSAYGRALSEAMLVRWQDPEYRKAISEAVYGEKNPNWKGGHDPYYGPDWLGQRRWVRARDEYTCQKCGVTEEELGRGLDVHHIRLYRETQDNSLENLVCLCSNCHRYCEYNPEEYSPLVERVP